MALSTNIGAYKDCEDYFSQALDAPKGIAIILDTPGMAKRMTQRMHQYRVLLRRQSEDVYPPGHPQYGTSVYDRLTVRTDPRNIQRLMVQPAIPAQVEEL